MNWRIFISYRGASVGESSTEEFGEKLYKYLTQDPLYKEKYGDVYFSPKTGATYGNFLKDVPEIMQTVEYFIMPLNDTYFEDFWDEDYNRPDEKSATYLEIREAIENKCHFICIAMPGYSVNEDLMKRLFLEDETIITGAITLSYDPANEIELFRRIGDSMVREDFGTVSMKDIIEQDMPNVFLSFKGQMEDSSRYPFYHKLHDVKKMVLVNFASSVFISGIQIASIYQEGDYLKRWFDYHLANGNIEIDMILTDPHSIAARDAALYKMYPSGQKVPTDHIIQTNINKLYRFKQENQNAKINLYLTDIVLPYGLMITEHNNPANDHMKVDLYAAVTNNDLWRPSFYLRRADLKTESLYNFFVSNAQNIMNNYSFHWQGHPDVSWITGQHIIHRAMISSGSLPHTKRSIEACLSAGYPMEIDLLELADGNIIIGRKDQDIAEYGVKDCLSNCTARDIRDINKHNGEEKLLFLRDFLKLVGGRVPVLFEIKTQDCGELDSKTIRFIDTIMKELEKYLSLFIPQRMLISDHSCHIAIHSTNPYVLKHIRGIDCMIPVGMISMGLSRIENNGYDDLYYLHNNAEYLNVITPDFLSYDIRDMNDGVSQRICDKLNIPLLAWTIRDVEDQQEAQDYRCDNIIIEGSHSFL